MTHGPGVNPFTLVRGLVYPAVYVARKGDLALQLLTHRVHHHLDHALQVFHEHCLLRCNAHELPLHLLLPRLHLLCSRSQLALLRSAAPRSAVQSVSLDVRTQAMVRHCIMHRGHCTSVCMKSFASCTDTCAKVGKPMMLQARFWVMMAPLQKPVLICSRCACSAFHGIR